jgi:hypothetical protein
MGKRRQAKSKGSRNKRSKKTAIVTVVPVAVSDVAASTVATPPVAAHSIEDEIKSSLFSIFSDVAASAVAASAVPVIPAVRVIGIVNRTSDMKKLVGSEQRLIISSPGGRQGIFKFADDIVNMITTKNPYNLRRVPRSLSQPWCQMMTTLKIIDVDAYHEYDTVKTLIRSTNLFPNLESITMRQPLLSFANRRRYLGVGWVTLPQTCYDDDNVCVNSFHVMAVL